MPMKKLLLTSVLMTDKMFSFRVGALDTVGNRTRLT